MPGSSSPFARFVVALHRRLCLLRLAERVGVGVAAGCGVAVLLVPILLWRQEDAWHVAWAAPALGGIAGAIWGVARLPTPLSAATEADRQLKLHDLLATAWAVRGSGDASGPANPWHRSVLAEADATAAEHAPAKVILHRLGMRAWAGIALALALVATLASFSSQPPRASASAKNTRVSGNDTSRTEAARAIVQIVSDEPEPRRRLEQNPAEEPLRGNMPLMADETETRPAEPPDPEVESSNKGSSSGSGDGSGRTDSAEPATENGDLSPIAGQETVSPTGLGRGAEGVGRASAVDPREQAGGGGTGTVAEPGADEATPPWPHPSWDVAVESAGRAIRAGRVPDDVRDLVRAYFD